MQFAVAGFGKWTNAEGVEEYQPNPLVSTLINVQGETWNSWGSDVDDSTFIGDLALLRRHVRHPLKHLLKRHVLRKKKLNDQCP
jgi:hypothetical protein